MLLLHPDSIMANSPTLLTSGTTTVRSGWSRHAAKCKKSSQTLRNTTLRTSASLSLSLFGKFLIVGFKNGDDWASVFSLSVMDARGRLRQELRSPIRHSCNNILPFWINAILSCENASEHHGSWRTKTSNGKRGK